MCAECEVGADDGGKHECCARGDSRSDRLLTRGSWGSPCWAARPGTSRASGFLCGSAAACAESLWRKAAPLSLPWFRMRRTFRSGSQHKLCELWPVHWEKLRVLERFSRARQASWWWRDLKPSLLQLIKEKKKKKKNKEGVTALKSLWRQLYDPRGCSECYGSGVSLSPSLSRAPAAERVRRKYRRDHFRSISSLRSARLVASSSRWLIYEWAFNWQQTQPIVERFCEAMPANRLGFF